jgi:hypothetical protein
MNHNASAVGIHLLKHALTKQIQDRLANLALRRAARAAAWSCVRHHRFITAHWLFVRSLG